ncbi:MAG: hypothetical protein QM820_08900 [Minicystis sp.]
MSVAVVVYFCAPDREPLYLPVATEAVFGRHWLPAAARLGLRWIPQFESGATVSAGELRAVVAELEQIRDAFAGNAATAPLVARVDSITAALGAIDPAEVREIFIG